MFNRLFCLRSHPGSLTPWVWGGAVQTVSLACASGVVAVGMARQAILRGEVDRALVVGVDALCNFIYRGFATLQALDVDGARPFDAHRAGLTVGEGGMAVTLERANGDLCVLGYGGSNDANHITGPARDGRGLVAALERAFDGTNLKPEQVGVGVLHGTGTRYNDAMEGVGYGRVFGPNAMPTLSVKGAIGHTMGAAGLANIIVAARSLRDGRVPPNVGLREQDPEIALDIVNGPPRSVARPYAVTSASGFAGVNAAVLLGPARQEPPRGRRKKQTPTPPNRPEPVVTAHVQIPSDRASAVARIGARAARRLDDLCVLGVAAADTLIASSALSPGDLQAEPLGLVLGTALGCLESDHGFYLRELNPEAYDPSPRLFAYTLPNIVLGETAIRHRLTGENVVVSAGRASGLVALTEADRRIRSGAWARAMVLIVDAVGPAAELLAPKMTGVAWAWLLEQRSLATARGAEIWGVAQGTVRRAPVGDLRTPARVVPPADGGEPLGAAGLEALSQHLRNRAPGTVEVVCPSGYAARVEWTPQR